MQQKLKDLEQSLKTIKSIKKAANAIYTGIVYRPLFYLTGMVYLFYLVLGAFQNFLGYTTIFFIANFITLSAWIYYIGYWNKTLKNYRKLEIIKIKWEYRTRRVLLHFLLLIIVYVFLSLKISIFIHDNYPKFSHTCDILRFYKITQKEAAQIICIFGILSLGIIPYMFFYFRERIFLNKFNEAFNRENLAFQEKLNEVKVISNMALRNLRLPALTFQKDLNTPEKNLSRNRRSKK